MGAMQFFNTRLDTFHTNSSTQVPKLLANIVIITNSVQVYHKNIKAENFSAIFHTSLLIRISYALMTSTGTLIHWLIYFGHGFAIIIIFNYISLRVTIRPRFPRHVLFFCLCLVGFSEIWLLSGSFPHLSQIDQKYGFCLGFPRPSQINRSEIPSYLLFHVICYSVP